MNAWAAIILWDGADPSTDRIQRTTGRERLTIAVVVSVKPAAEIAQALVEAVRTVARRREDHIGDWHVTVFVLSGV